MAVYECKYCKRKFRIKPKLTEHEIKFHKTELTDSKIESLKKIGKKTKQKKSAPPPKSKKAIKKKKNCQYTKIIYVGLPETNRRRH